VSLLSRLGTAAAHKAAYSLEASNPNIKPNNKTDILSYIRIRSTSSSKT
jgi:hypothetical protein